MTAKSKSKSHAVIDELSPFLQIFYDRYMADDDMPADVHPLNVMKQLAKEQPPSRIAQGLIMAVNDCLEMASYMPPEDRRALDTVLSEKSIVTLTELRRRHSTRYRRILERRKITRLTDYYLIRNMISDNELPADESKRLGSMLAAYEERHRDMPPAPTL